MCKYINIVTACYSKYFKLRIFKVNRKQLTSNCCKLNSKTVVINITSPVCQCPQKKICSIVIATNPLSTETSHICKTGK